MRNRRTMAKIAVTLVATAFLLTSCIIILPWLEGEADLTLELTWSGDEDLDLYLTYPDVDTTESATVPNYLSVADAYFVPTPAGNSGFAPEDGTANRDRVYEDRTQSADGDVVWQNYGDNREVIKIKELPFNYTLGSGDYNTTADSENGLPSGYTYAWVGVLEAYVWGHDANASDADDVTLSVYDDSDRLLGEYLIPAETRVKGAALVRIPVFQVQGEDLVYYQVLAHTQLLTSVNQIRSVGDSQTIDEYHVLGTFSNTGDE
ncbi:MAG: hypothetical protein ACLFNT_07660 [Spirochaetales bacterium]